MLKSPQGGDQGRKEKNRGDEPIWVIIHIYMETSPWKHHSETPCIAILNKEK
jgi:hypothetical protein